MSGKAKPVKRSRRLKELSQDPRRLYRARIASGKTLRQAAAEAGISFGHLSDLEHGNFSAGVLTLAALATVYKREIAELMPRDEPNGNAA